MKNNFLKSSISVGIHKQVILSVKISQKPVPDTKHAEKLLRQTQRTRKSECFVLDRGYDPEGIHRQVREEIGADSIIPVRKWNGKCYSGKYRYQVKENKIKLILHTITKAVQSVVFVVIPEEFNRAKK